ncbi:MAG: hypothetical protein DMG30_28900 [Acidobacteria bacterium]|nr:MAG: hypothetical protein DMG30_28900 [Acidobacteriota bacterium]PYU69092.1 MAG: hypothetical protein DMG52_29785 [Acidobacteriota bacterium]
MKKSLLLSFALLLILPLGHAQGLGTTTVTNQVSVTVAAEAALTIGASATTLTSTGTNFSDYTGTTPFTYFIRTGKTAGSGFIKLQVTTDFAPSGGPSVATPLTPGDTLSYTCTVSSPGTACSGSQTSSTASQMSVATFSTDAHSAKVGNSASVTWDLSNDPLYQTGTFTAVVTYTISAS